MANFNKKSMVALVIVSFALSFVGPVAALAAGPAAVDLGSAANFAILAKTGISTTGSTSIVGNVGVSPVAASYITGFGLMADNSNVFSTSALVTGKIYAANYAVPTPTTMTTAVSDMQTAYTDAAGRTNPTETEMGAGSIGGTTLVPGLYKWGTSVTIPTDMTLSGGSNDVWIFQIAGNLTMSSATHIILSGGAQASNVFWVVAGQTTIGTTAVFNGNILDQTGIVLNTGATLNGRALAQSVVTLDANTVTGPTAASSVPAPVLPPTPTPTSTPVSAPTSTPALVSVSVPTSTPAPTYSYAPATVTVTQTAPTSSLTQTPSPTPSNAPALQAQLNSLLATLHSLQAQAGQQITTPATNLGIGSRGSDVATLQQFLIAQNKGSAAQALANAGATGYFGTLTHAALAEFQSSVGISPALGNFGAITRAYLGAHY